MISESRTEAEHVAFFLHHVVSVLTTQLTECSSGSFTVANVPTPGLAEPHNSATLTAEVSGPADVLGRPGPAV